VLHVCADDLHVVSEIEALPEAGGNAPMKHFCALLLIFLARNQKRAAVLDQFDLVRRKAGDRHGDSVLVFAFLLDVVSRSVGSNALIEQVKEPVEADRRAIVGSKVESSHSHILREATWI
jgi:hypothetical protein